MAHDKADPALPEFDGSFFSSIRQEVSLDYADYSIHVVDGPISSDERRKLLKTIEANSSHLTKTLLNDYIWHCESFSLVSEKLNGKQSIPENCVPLKILRDEGKIYLRGRTRFAESLEDEWLIAYLLLESTKSLGTVWTQIQDSDGEFLLVEAAAVLPRWLKPQIAENRVWINQGKLFIIPTTKACTSGGSGIDGPITKNVALEFLENYPGALLRLERLETKALRRVRCYPGQMSENLHRSKVTIPRKLAYILHENPNYISPVLESFFTWSGSKTDPPTSSSARKSINIDDLVTSVVKFTKVAFARFRSDLYGSLNPAFPISTTPGIAADDERSFKLGMKLTFAFETLVSDPEKKDLRAAREIKLMLEDLESQEAILPTDDDMRSWESTVDDEKWLEVNLEDLDMKFKNGLETLDDREAPSGVLSYANQILKKHDNGPEDFLFDDLDVSESSDDTDEADHLDDMPAMARVS